MGVADRPSQMPRNSRPRRDFGGRIECASNALRAVGELNLNAHRKIAPYLAASLALTTEHRTRRAATKLDLR